MQPDKTTGAAFIRVSGFVNESIVDGPGIRMVIFAQGCERRCPGCHNPETHDPGGGRLVSAGEIMAVAKKNPLLRGLTFSGGEPFLQAAAFSRLARMAHDAGLDVMTYTGYTIEEILEHGKIGDSVAVACDIGARDSGAPSDADGFLDLLYQTDILVDGPFIQELRTLDAPYKGSSNQRVIDVAATLAGL